MQEMRVNPVLAKFDTVRGQVLEFPIMRDRAARREQTLAATNIKKHNDSLLIRYKREKSPGIHGFLLLI